MHSGVRQLPLDIRWHDIASLEQFVPGANAQALADVRALLDGPSCAPVLLWGKAGSGKTHLLQAACRHLGEQGSPVVCLPARQVSMTPDVLTGLDDMALVAVDDIDRLAGDARAEEALFHCYNRCREGGTRLLLGARHRPGDLPFALADLRSRLGWGLVHRLQPLRDEELADALSERARLRGLDLPDDTLRFLLTRLPRDPARLFGVLDELDRAALAAQRRLTIPFVRQILRLGDGVATHQFPS